MRTSAQTLQSRAHLLDYRSYQAIPSKYHHHHHNRHCHHHIHQHHHLIMFSVLGSSETNPLPRQFFFKFCHRSMLDGKTHAGFDSYFVYLCFSSHSCFRWFVTHSNFGVGFPNILLILFVVSRFVQQFRCRRSNNVASFVWVAVFVSPFVFEHQFLL